MPRIKKTLSAAAKATIAKHGEDFCTRAADDYSSGDVKTIRDLARLNNLAFSEAERVIDAGKELLEIQEANRPETNVEFMVRIMEPNPMIQLFVMDSLMKQAEAVAKMPKDELRKQFETRGAASFINPDAWHAVATEIVSEFKEKNK